MFGTNFTGVQRNKTKFFCIKSGSKQDKTKFYHKKNSSKQNETLFQNTVCQNFFFVTYLRHRTPSKICVTMVNGRSVCLMRFVCEVCLSHWMSPTFRGLILSAFFSKKVNSKRNQIIAISRQNKTKRNEISKYFRLKHP